MMSCKEITLLIEKSKEKKLTFLQRLELKLHFKLCKVCHTYSIDSGFLDRILKKRSVTFKPLDPSEKETMKNQIEKVLN